MQDLAEARLRNDPFAASYLGVSGYDDAVPDLSPQAPRAWRDRLVDVVARCEQLEADVENLDSRVLLAAVRDDATRGLALADSRVQEFGVTTLPLGGPSMMLLVAARAPVSNAASASAYLTRCQGLATYLDQYAERLRSATGSGLLPVAPLVHDVIEQLRDYLAHPARDPLVGHRPPQGWDGAAAWREELERVVRDEVRPALGQHLDLLVEMLPRSRPSERAGLLHVPGGRALGARSAGEVMSRLRQDASLQAAAGRDPMARAAAAIARAEERLAELFHPPLPPPCTIEPMPAHLAESGIAPMYSPPARDGSRAGAYLFNHVNPGPAGSWALEATAFHEGVPGHHAQFARLQLVPDVPLLLRAFFVVAHGEGWGLYAERLADESACTPTTCSGWACSAVRPGEPCAWSSTPVCTPVAGAARGLWRSRWPTPRCPSRSWAPRSTGTSPCPARHSGIWSVSARSCGCATTPARALARLGTSVTSTPPSSTTAASHFPCSCRWSRHG